MIVIENILGYWMFITFSILIGFSILLIRGCFPNSKKEILTIHNKLLHAINRLLNKQVKGQTVSFIVSKDDYKEKLVGKIDSIKYNPHARFSLFTMEVLVDNKIYEVLFEELTQEDQLGIKSLME